MNPDELKDFQPSWKSDPAPPTRIPGDGDAANFRPSTFTDGAHVDSSLPEKEIPDRSGPELKFYCWKDGVAGTITVRGGNFVKLAE